MLLPVCVIFTLVSLKYARSENCASCSDKDLQHNYMQQNTGENYSDSNLYKLLAKRLSDVSSIQYTGFIQPNEIPGGRDEIETGSLTSGLKKRNNDCKSKRWIYLPCLRKYKMGQLTATQAKHYAKMMHVLFGIGK